MHKRPMQKDPDAVPRHNPRLASLLAAGYGFEGRVIPAGDGRRDTEAADEISEHPRDAKSEIEYELRKAVLRVVLGHDNRSLAEVSAELGLTRQAASRVHALIIARLGWANLFSKPARRAKNEEAARRRWKKEKARARVTEPEPAIETGTEKASSKVGGDVNGAARAA